MIVADREEAIAEAAAKIGRLEAGRIVKDRSALDYIRVFVGKAEPGRNSARAAADAGRLSSPSVACPSL